jgi:hypothetical protein
MQVLPGPVRSAWQPDEPTRTSVDIMRGSGRRLEMREVGRKFAGLDSGNLGSLRTASWNVRRWHILLAATGLSRRPSGLEHLSESVIGIV